MAKLTPMMQQYMNLKQEHKDSILLFRLGDFYEMFFEDAEIASKELELVLTGRDCGLEERAPMCGIPHHAAEGYVAQLVNKGYKVAICEQLEDPSDAKGIVKRGITRVITPGTVVESSMLEESENNYILSICFDEEMIGLSYSDISTGEFYIKECENKQELISEWIRINPKEIITADSSIKDLLKLQNKTQLTGAFINPYFDWAFEVNAAEEALLSHFHVDNLSSFGCEEISVGVSAAGGLIQYLRETQKNSLIHINKISVLQEAEYMVLDSTTIRNLELTQTIMTAEKKGSVLWLLDKTKTAPGARLLKKYLLQPLKDIQKINDRLDAVSEIESDLYLKNALNEHLHTIYDLERIISRISYGTINARDCLSLKGSIKQLPIIKELLKDVESSLLKNLYDEIDELRDVYQLLDEAIHEDPGTNIQEGNIIKKGFNSAIDDLIDITEGGQQWLAELQIREREETGIKNLKIGYNKVFGYYIEITKSHLEKVPYRYHRKQTLTNSERYITEELKEMEEKILGADEKRCKLEYEIFLSLRDTLGENIDRIQQSTNAIAVLDVIGSFAQVALEKDFVRPTITNDGAIDLKDNRHPVVEEALGEQFVPNDVYLDMEKSNLLLITGPNMAGKSTYMRQAGLAVLLSHIGCFVPCSSASICLVDRLFTRVGASDDLAAGQSTFMVEMNELANILNNATSDSLLILDEIGRGTSTVDGLSIAKASIEYIIKKVRAKTLFATHFHELIELEKEYPQIRNCSVAVKEIGQEIVFLHKMIDGGTNRSFGIEVARLAGLPDEVISNSKKELRKLQKSSTATGHSAMSNPVDSSNSSGKNGLTTLPISVETLLKTNIDTLTPIEALNLVNLLKEEIQQELDQHDTH